MARGFPVEAVVGMMPVEQRVTEPNGQFLLSAGFDEEFERIFGEGSGVDDIEARQRAFEQAKAVVVFGGEDDIARACGFRELGPGVGVEPRRVEAWREFLIFTDRQFVCFHDVRALADERGNTPVEEQAELLILKARARRRGHPGRREAVPG